MLLGVVEAAAPRPAGEDAELARFWAYRASVADDGGIAPRVRSRDRARGRKADAAPARAGAGGAA